MAGLLSAKGEAGLSLVEVLVATMVVSLLALATHGVTGLILDTRSEADDADLVDELGVSLLEEIAVLPFNDPQDGGTSIGPETGEWVPNGDRVLFDDVDDYAVWNGSPPLQQKDGTLINISNYTRTVSVSYVNPSNFNLASFTPTDSKRITVYVLRNGTVAKRFSTVRIEGGRYVDDDG